MDDKDKIIVKDSTSATVGVIVSAIPYLSGAWNLYTSLKGAGYKLRVQRVVEFVEDIRNHQDLYTRAVLTSEAFQDGFVIALSRYVLERSKERRRIFRNIFRGFAEAEDRENFPLEKFVHTLSQLSERDIDALRHVDVTKYKDRNYQVFGDTEDNIDNVFNLIGVNILVHEAGSRLGSITAPFVRITPFGTAFTVYLS